MIVLDVENGELTPKRKSSTSCPVVCKAMQSCCDVLSNSLRALLLWKVPSGPMELFDNLSISPIRNGRLGSMAKWTDRSLRKNLEDFPDSE